MELRIDPDSQIAQNRRDVPKVTDYKWLDAFLKDLARNPSGDLALKTLVASILQNWPHLHRGAVRQYLYLKFQSYVLPNQNRRLQQYEYYCEAERHYAREIRARERFLLYLPPKTRIPRHCRHVMPLAVIEQRERCEIESAIHVLRDQRAFVRFRQRELKGSARDTSALIDLCFTLVGLMQRKHYPEICGVLNAALRAAAAGSEQWNADTLSKTIRRYVERDPRWCNAILDGIDLELAPTLSGLLDLSSTREM